LFRDGDALGSEVHFVEIPSWHPDLPPGLVRDAMPPSRATDHVLSRTGARVPRTRRFEGEASTSAAPPNSGRAVLLTGEDVGDLRRLGNLHSLPWGASVLQSAPSRAEAAEPFILGAPP